MRHSLRATFALLALVAVPQFAFAGPIHWGYRAESPNGTLLTERTGLTDLSWGDFFFPDPQTHGTLVPDPNPGNDLQSFIYRTEATVILTDEISGQSATFGLFYEYVEQYEIRPDGSLDPRWAGYNGGFTGENANAPWQGVPFVLGGNTYTVRTLGGDFMVSVEPVASPEPSTLALAALGVGGMGVVRRLRRA